MTTKKRTKKVRALLKGKKIEAKKPLTSGGGIEINSWSFGLRP